MNQYVADMEPELTLLSGEGLGRLIATAIILPKVNSVSWFLSCGALTTLGLCLLLSWSRRRIEVAAACGRCGQVVKVAVDGLEQRSAICDACTQVFLLGRSRR